MSGVPYPCDDKTGSRIKELRRSLGLTQKEFADSLGIVQGFLSGIERGRKTPSDTLLIALSHRYGLNERWLSTGQGEMSRGSDTHSQPPAEPCKGSVPLLARITEDFPTKVDVGDVRDHVSLPSLPAGCYAIEAYGDFMAPTIRDADLVIFRPGGEPANGAIVLVTNRWGEAIIRRCRDKGGARFFSPDNAAYAPFQPDPETRIIGTVEEVWRKVKL